VQTNQRPAQVKQGREPTNAQRSEGLRPTQDQIGQEFFDRTFDAKAAVTDEVKTIAIQPDGRILVGGSNGLVKRLLPNGLPDSSFTAPSFRGADVNAIAIQPGGQILVGGTLLGGGQSFVRLTANGAIDGTFNPPRLIGTVEEIVVQPDGHILVGGVFRVDTGTPREFRRDLVRLAADGPLVGDFRPDPRGNVRAIELLPDGRLLIGGAFGDVGGFRLANLALLSPDGVVDETFDPDPNGDVFSITVLSDGRILIGGSFTAVDGMPRRGLALLSSSGELDNSFNPSIPERIQVHAVAAEDDGKILVGGLHLAMRASAVTVHTLVRLLPNGQLDTGFVPFKNSFALNDIARQSDGKFLIGGLFTDNFRSDFGRVVRLLP
jgi:uncharacterized delta-60 repeat protein